jgi:hypothetical protein
MTTFNKYFKDFINVLNHNNVRYVILRGYENLPDIYSNDLDFAIHPSDKDNFFLALTEYKTLHDVKIRINLSRYEVLKLKFHFGNEEIDFDFWFDINFCGLEYISVSEVVNKARMYKNFMIPNVEDELTISFLKELLHMKRLRKDKVVWLTRKVEESNLEFFATFFSTKTKEYIIKVIRDRKFDLKELSIKTKLELIKFHLKNRNIKKTILKISSFIYLRLRSNKNPLVIKLKEK